MKREFVVIPQVKINPQSITLYNTVQWLSNKPVKRENNTQYSTLIQVEKDGVLTLQQVSTRFLNSTRKSNGILSKPAKKKLTTAIDYFLMINKPNKDRRSKSGSQYQNCLSFITLTLPSKQNHTDNEIKSSCLNQFLVEISKYHHVTQYVWRSEYQKNGNIHFHLLVNRYIHWSQVRDRWNRIINKLGYVDVYRTELKKFHESGFQVRKDLLKNWNAKAQYRAFKFGTLTDWHNPNSIDVHSVRGIRNLGSYLTKYMSKNESETNQQLSDILENKKDIGRIWGCSTLFSNIKGAINDVDSTLEHDLKKLEELKPDLFFHGDYFTVIHADYLLLEELKLFELLKLFFGYCSRTFDYHHQLIT